MELNIKKLLRDLNNPDDDLRALSAMTLMKVEVIDPTQRQELFNALMKGTKDKNIAVRFFARRAIDKLRKDKDLEGDGQPAQKAIDPGLASEHYDERLQAVMRIAKENKTEYKDRLIAMLQTEHHDFVKATLISSLRKFLNKTEGLVISPFLKDPDSRVRSNTIESLEAIKADGAIPLLFPCLEDPDNRIRAVAAKALQSFGEEKVFTHLRKMLNSNDEWMKFSAIHALSHINAGESIQMLIDAAKPPAQPDTRVRAIVALANFHDLTGYGFLKHLVESKDEIFKPAAQKAIKLMEEKFGTSDPPRTTLVKQKGVEEKPGVGEKGKPAKKPQDLTSSVVKLFRKGTDEAVTLSQTAAIKFALTDLEKEGAELAKEAGRVVFEIYQRGDLQLPELLTISHEILRMNFYIQKYTDEELKTAAPAGDGGLFSQIKNLFSSSTKKKTPENSQAERFTQNREDLFLKLGKAVFKKMGSGDFQSVDLDGCYQGFLKLQQKIALEKGKMNSS